jgi:hypothetical protein
VIDGQSSDPDRQTRAAISAELFDPQRADRLVDLIGDLSREELIKTVLRAIDHAYGSAAELGARLSMFEAEHGPIADLIRTNDELRRENERLSSLVASEPQERHRQAGPRLKRSKRTAG